MAVQTTSGLGHRPRMGKLPAQVSGWLRVVKRGARLDRLPRFSNATEGGQDRDKTTIFSA